MVVGLFWFDGAGLSLTFTTSLGSADTTYQLKHTTYQLLVATTARFTKSYPFGIPKTPKIFIPPSVLSILDSMSKRNIKVSEIVYDTLEEEKKGDETFDDVLRRKLELLPKIDDLIAYLPKKIRNEARELVKHITGLGKFERKVEQEDRRDILHFIPNGSDITIAQAIFTEDSVRFKYRNRKGDLEIVKHSHLYEGHNRDIDRIKKDSKQKIEGALRKWG